MGCRTYQRQLSKRLDDRTAGSSELSAHLASCPHCAGHWSLLRRSRTTLAQLGPASPPSVLARTAVALAIASPRKSGEDWIVRFVRLAMPTAALGLIAAIALAWTAPSSRSADHAMDPVATVVASADLAYWTD